jgi:hypothetical protein
MPHVISPQVWPQKDGDHSLSDGDFFNKLFKTPRVKTVRSSNELDTLPLDLEVLAASHGVNLAQTFLEGMVALAMFVLVAGGCVLSFPLVVMYGPQALSSVTANLDPNVASIVQLGIAAMIAIVVMFVISEVIARRRKRFEAPAEAKVAPAARKWHKKGGMRLGMGWIVLDQPQYALGDTIRFIYNQKVVKPTRLQGGAVRLILLEASRHDAITYQIHHQDSVELDRMPIPSGSYQPGERIQVRGEFTLPEYAPGVLITPNHRMVYMLAVQLDVADQPMGELLYHLPVEPSVVVDKVQHIKFDA